MNLIYTLASRARIAWEFFLFLLRAKTKDGIDSPFLTCFLQQLLSSDSLNDPQIPLIEKKRKRMIRDESRVHFYDPGAPSKYSSSKKRTVKSIAMHSISDPYKCRLLLNCLLFFKPSRILELGTSLGISTSYLALPSFVSHLDSIEGNVSLLKIAINTTSPFEDRIHLHKGTFHDILTKLTMSGMEYDLIYLDGSHRYHDTVEYVNRFKKISHSSTVILIDDIYWSHEMKKAWSEIKSERYYNVYLDLFYFGLVTHHSNIHETIDMKILPFSYRWKPYLFR